MILLLLMFSSLWPAIVRIHPATRRTQIDTLSALSQSQVREGIRLSQAANG